MCPSRSSPVVTSPTSMMRPSSPSPSDRKWTCASTKPGVTMAPSRSTVSSGTILSKAGGVDVDDNDTKDPVVVSTTNPDATSTPSSPAIRTIPLLNSTKRGADNAGDAGDEK